MNRIMDLNPIHSHLNMVVLDLATFNIISLYFFPCTKCLLAVLYQHVSAIIMLNFNIFQVSFIFLFLFYRLSK